MRLAGIALAALGFALNTPSVHAEPLTDGAVQSVPQVLAGYRDHPLHLEWIFGADTRVGELGVSAEYAPGELLSIGLGIGMNYEGPEYSAHARLRPIWARTPGGDFFQALTVEGSLSRATQGNGFQICVDECEAGVVAQTVYWGQVEVGWEGMLRHGFTVRASSGIATALGSRLWHCEGEASSCQAPPRQLYVQTFALGYAF